MATDAELNEMTNQNKLNRINLGHSAWHYLVHRKSAENRLRDADNNVAALVKTVAALPGKIVTAFLDTPITLKGHYNGTISSIRTRMEWMPHEQRKSDLILANQKRIEEKLDQVLAQKEGTE